MRTLFTLALLLAGSAQAAPWTFDQLLQAAQTSHPLVAGKEAARNAAKAEREGAEWQRYPTPSVEANTDTHGDQASVFRLDQPLWTGGRITSNLEQADRRLDAAGSAIQESRLELALKVIAAAGEAARQQIRQEHAAAGVKEHNKLLAMIQRRVEQEVSPQADLRLAQSRLYSANNDLSFSRQGLDNALTQLSQLAGRKVTGLDAASWNQAAGPEGLPAELDQAVQQALAHSPTQRRLAFEDEAAAAEIEGKKAVYLPQLTLRLESMQGATSDHRAMLVLLAQPGAGLSAGSGVDAAVARREAARLTREAARRDVQDQVTLDWNEWQAARARAENAEQARASAAEVAESYARQYTAGRKSWLDVLNAVRENTQAELSLADAQAQMRAAALRLKARIGLLK